MKMNNRKVIVFGKSLIVPKVPQRILNPSSFLGKNFSSRWNGFSAGEPNCEARIQTTRLSGGVINSVEKWTLRINSVVGRCRHCNYQARFITLHLPQTFKSKLHEFARVTFL